MAESEAKPEVAATNEAEPQPSIYEAALANELRPEADRARDAGRKPGEVLEFLGIGPGMSVLDMFSGGGWYAEVIALDSEWKTSGPRGPLHGIPVILNANIDTADQMYTSAGLLALAEHVPPSDAFVVKRLRDSGAVMLGKANLSEWANFRSTRSQSGWSSVGGQTRNAYDTTRSPCGSSSGSAVSVAANLTTVSIGTETDGSVVCPASYNGVVGIKPTLGLVSRSGIIPLAHSQDTAGPMGRTVRDAAILLTAMTGTDPDDAETSKAETHHDYSSNLTADALNGKRIGVIRSWYGAGSNPDVDATYQASIEKLKESVMPWFGQEIFLDAEAKGPLTDEAYLAALETSKRISRSSIDDLMDEHDLDAMIAPTNGPARPIDLINGDASGIGSSSLAAVSGYPSITVPAGFVSGMPIGLSFIGKAWNEKQLIEIAYAFEQTTGVRKPPEF